MGTRYVSADPDRAVCELEVTTKLHQPGGIVHGGVYSALAEACASSGGLAWLAGNGIAVGVSNHTDFIRAVREGSLRAEATPLQRGRRLQLWQVAITEAQVGLVAHAKVRLANVRDTPSTPPTSPAEEAG
ncbi:PaaI family thioesterase [Egibacter rhizosphaerae]|uniref:PaaI family thioesterase n=2 Tax=Egibacter rhizosphaerae TaxID=1670831 RepID=A0A411YDS8_9ACTN|nr:PaaI family thioesterase [Egibacter rhizosphaerae]